MSPDKFADRDALLLAQLAGELIHDVVVDLMQLLGARNEAKRLARSVNQTVIQPLNNNPLKFSPTREDALHIMLGPPTKSYLDARRALAQGFGDSRSTSCGPTRPCSRRSGRSRPISIRTRSPPPTRRRAASRR